MKLFNLITYQEYITKYKGYKQIGTNHYYNYCATMNEYVNSIYTKCHYYNNIEYNTKLAEQYYRMNVCPNFG